MADVDQRNVDGISLPTTYGRYNPPGQDQVVVSCSSSDEHLSTSSNPRRDYENFSNGFNNNGIGEADFQSQEPYTGPPGFQNIFEFGQIPPPPNDPFGLQQSWPGYPPIMAGPQGFYNGVPAFNPHQPIGFIPSQTPWHAFEAPPSQSEQEEVLANHNSLEEFTHSPWWRPGQYIQQNNWGWDANPNGSNKFGGFAGGYGGGKSDLVAYEDKFRTQVAKYSMLPIDIHKKIQSMPGCEITNYFEVTVVRFRLGNIVDLSDCHAIFTTKPETRQCWLMAFSTKDRSRSLIKFNRLLTSHLKVKVNGKTAIELQPSKASPSREEEEYLFNFKDEKTANEFVTVLHTARSQVWNHEHVEQQAFPGHFVLQPTRFQPMDCNHFGLGFAAGQQYFQGRRFQYQRPNQRSRRDNVVDSQTFRGSLQGKLWPQYSTGETRGDGKKEMDEKNKINKVIYSANATLLVKCGNNDYVVLGQGEMTIVEHLSYDELMFFGPNRNLICSHNIYKWCDLETEEAEENKYICKWFAPVMLSISPSELPINRHLKMEVEEQGLLVKFRQVVSGCKEKALKLALG